MRLAFNSPHAKPPHLPKSTKASHCSSNSEAQHTPWVFHRKMIDGRVILCFVTPLITNDNFSELSPRNGLTMDDIFKADVINKVWILPTEFGDVDVIIVIDI